MNKKSEKYKNGMDEYIKNKEKEWEEQKKEREERQKKKREEYLQKRAEKMIGLDKVIVPDKVKDKAQSYSTQNEDAKVYTIKEGTILDFNKKIIGV